MILRLRYYGDPILREATQPVTEITDEIRELCHNMIESMLHYDGVGLAAPQVGYRLRIFVSNLVGENPEGGIIVGEPKVYINPVLSNHSESMVERSEGCLSIPKLYLPIIRPLSIHLDATNLDGKLFHEECYGYQARNRMHENDHLNGVLFIDRIKGKKRTLLEPELRRIKQQYYGKSF